MEAVIRGAAIYAVLLIIIRLSGRRTLAQMTPFDLVLLLIVAETTQQALLGDDFSLVNSVVLILTLFAIDIGLSFVKQRFGTLEKWLDGQPTLLLSHGEPDARTLSRARLSTDDILEAARSRQGLERLDQIRFAVLETTGEISIIPQKD
ncbi:DUF421 domain-containing protein [Brevundimonas sp. GCM10030266]|uniref:DUF421 domain-containing protein n=1 Tax=Brevundimonas sp. GCM10030266 TaxID=3273386 RepID=UPI00360D5397